MQKMYDSPFAFYGRRRAVTISQWPGKGRRKQKDGNVRAIEKAWAKRMRKAKARLK